MERDPHMLIEGMLIAGYALGSTSARWREPYLTTSDTLSRRLVPGLVGDKILGTTSHAGLYTQRPGASVVKRRRWILLKGCADIHE